MKTLMKRDYICVFVFYVLFVALFSIGTACTNSTSSSSSLSSSIVENTSVCKGTQGTEVIDNNEWIYGTWECQTQYGTMRLIINDDGRMYDTVEERWCSYSIEGDDIVEHILDGLVSTYHIDRVNKRFDCGNNRDWFIKVSN